VWKSPKSKNHADVAGDDVPFNPQQILSLDVPTVLWGANYFADRLPPSSGWLVWDKERPDDLDQATCELAWTNCVKGVRRFRHLWNGMIKASEHGDTFHPTQKPAALFEWILALRWIPVGTVVDPYGGSFPCAVACIRIGREYRGCELVEAYCEIGAKRCDRELDQGRLPFALPEPAPVQREMFE
jgi:hypothetical protein